MNQLAIIENDIKALQSETKKKFDKVKESLNAAVVVFNSYKQGASKGNTADFPINELLKPVSLIPATKHDKMIVCALSLIKNLLNYGYLKDKNLVVVVIFLQELVEIQDDNIQVKLLQTMLLFITPKHLDFNQFELIERLLTLSLQMYSSKNIIVHNTTTAALFQLASMIFEHFLVYLKANKIQGQENNNMEQKADLSHFFYQRCIKLLKEFVLITSGTRPEWVPGNVNLPRDMGLDLVNTVFKQVGHALEYSKEAHQVIKKDLIPILMKSFEPKQNNFITLVRILRSTSRILLNLNDGLELMEYVLNLLNHSDLDSERFLCTESLVTIFGNPDMMKTLNQRHISTISYFSETLNVLLKVVQALASHPDINDRKKFVPLNHKVVKLLENNISEFEVPHISVGHIIKSITEFLQASVESLIVVSKELGFKLDSNNSDVTGHEQNNLRDWINGNWKILLKIIKGLLPITLDESVTQQILNSTQKFITLTGSLQLTQARDSYIMALCGGCLPVTEDTSLKDFSTKNIQTTKALFNVAHCLGGILDVDSWHMILSTLQKTDMIFSKIKSEIQPNSGQATLQPKRQTSTEDKNAIKKLVKQEDESNLSLDLQILNSAQDSLFGQSRAYPIEHFDLFINALNQLSLDYMEKITTENTLIIDGIQIDASQKIFGLQKMLQAILANIDRIDLFWDLVSAHFVCITSAKNNIIRAQGVENLNIVIEKGFNYFSDQFAKNPNFIQERHEKENEHASETFKHKKSKSAEDWSSKGWQSTIFTPYIESVKTRFLDVKESICHALIRLLENNGHRINHRGWNSICMILIELSTESGKIVALGFKCIESIINDYLHDLTLEEILLVIKIIENFKKVSSDNNVSYQSVGMFWKVGDHVARLQAKTIKIEGHGLERFEEIWCDLLERLMNLSCDNQSEMRQSAIHTFFTLLIDHGSIFQLDFWNKLFNDKIYKLVDHILELYLSNTRVDSNANLQTPKFSSEKQIKFDEPQKMSPEEKQKHIKSWVDTLSTLIQHLLKTTKRFVQQIEDPSQLSLKSFEVQVLKSVLVKLKGVIMVSRNELIAEAAKVYHELILVPPQILSHIAETVFDVLNTVKTLLNEVRKDAREIKVVINKFIPEVLAIIMDLYKKERYEAINVNKLQFCKHLFEIIEKAIFYSKQAEAFNSISPQKVITDVKTVYDFFEKVPKELCENNDEMTTEYFKFTVQILGASVSDKFTDLVIRKFLSILQQNLCQGVFDFEVSLPQLPAIFETIKGILNLRCNNEFLAQMVNTSQNSLPIWLFTTDYFLNIVDHVLKQFSEYKKNNQENQKPEILELINTISGDIIAIFEDILKSGEKSLENISKGILSEIKRDWFEMDMKFINAIGGCIVPNALVMRQEALWKLINILDFTFSFYSKNNLFSEQSASYGKDPATHSTISKITLEILFKISESHSDPSNSGDSQKNILSKFATKKLIMKCKNILKRYLYEEQRSGSMPLPRNRILEICYILDKLKGLTIPENMFNLTVVKPSEEKQKQSSPSKNVGQQFEDDDDDRINQEDAKAILDFSQNEDQIAKLATINTIVESNDNEKLIQGNKGHLIYLMPLFADCIVCKDPELKELLRNIFREISGSIGFYGAFK